jgi:parvulin-like peptidyl-prolyl isomerase
MKVNANFSTKRPAAVKQNPERASALTVVTRLLAVTGLICSSFVALSCKGGAPAEELAARVGPREIKVSQIDAEIKQQLDAGGGASFTSTELLAARLSVLSNLIQEEALFQRAQRENLVPDDNKVTQEIQKTKQQAGWTEDQYQNSLKQSGMTEQDVRDRARRQLAINALYDKEKARVPAPTDSEIEKYFNDRKSTFVAERGVDISVIVTDPATNGGTDDAVGAPAAEQKIKAIYDQLKTGDFATIAAERSEHASRVRSGALGFATEVDLKQTFATLPELSPRLFAMSQGQYTEPMRDGASGAWLIFKLNAKREQSQNLALEDVKKNIIDTITQQRQQVLIEAIKMVALAETNLKNLLAEKIAEKPETMIMMSPSRILETKTEPQQPAPRIVNENSAPTNANQAAKPGSSSQSANANRTTQSGPK